MNLWYHIKYAKSIILTEAGNSRRKHFHCAEDWLSLEAHLIISEKSKRGKIMSEIKISVAGPQDDEELLVIYAHNERETAVYYEYNVPSQ